MIPELGHFALVIAFCISIALTIIPIWGAAKGINTWMAFSRPASYAQFLFVLIAFIFLTYSFLVDDFSVLYVASQSNSALPDMYKVSAVWGGHEGSMLLWILMLSGWGAASSSTAC